MLIASMLCACADKKAGELGDYIGGEGGADYGGSSGNGEGQGEAGKVTAGEWRDLDNWDFWSNLMNTNEECAQYCSYWSLYPEHRVAVRVTDEGGTPQRDVPVQLVRLPQEEGESTTVLYESRTDNRGETNLWIGLTQHQSSVDSAQLQLIVNSIQRDLPVCITNWGDSVRWNECTATVVAGKQIDIAFIVDATGSMWDEIDFLKADLRNIIQTVATQNSSAEIRTAALFYRDEGDEYVTRVSDFTSDLAATTAFIGNQNADGGGDYPEAVHTALEKGLQQLAWSEDNCIRLAFMLLDAPPHHNETVIQSLTTTIPRYAQRGIRIIPVAASGVDKSTEFFLRFTAMATDATYVFITNDSGIGGEHLEPTIGQYKVEQLNELIVRLIGEYME